LEWIKKRLAGMFIVGEEIPHVDWSSFILVKNQV
jgi:hypothetical protein